MYVNHQVTYEHVKLSKTRMCCVSSLAWIIDSSGLIWLQSLKHWRTYRFQEFDLIHRCLCVMFCTLHYLHSNKPLHPVTTEKATFAKRKRQFASGVTVDSANAEKKQCMKNMEQRMHHTGCPRPATRSRSGPSPICGWHDIFRCKDLPLLHGGNHLQENIYSTYWIQSAFRNIC